MCNHKCFVCPYPDCIDDTITREEKRQAQERDEKADSRQTSSKKWTRDHREEERTRVKNYYYSHKERYHNYYLEHKEELSRKRKEKNAKIEV